MLLGYLQVKRILRSIARIKILNVASIEWKEKKWRHGFYVSEISSFTFMTSLKAWKFKTERLKLSEWSRSSVVKTRPCYVLKDIEVKYCWSIEITNETEKDNNPGGLNSFDEIWFFQNCKTLLGSGSVHYLSKEMFFCLTRHTKTNFIGLFSHMFINLHHVIYHSVSSLEVTPGRPSLSISDFVLILFSTKIM